MGLAKRKGVFEQTQNAQIQIHPRMRKITSGHLLSVVTFFCAKEVFSGQRMSCSDCAGAQSDLDIHCPHMPAWRGLYHDVQCKTKDYKQYAGKEGTDQTARLIRLRSCAV